MFNLSFLLGDLPQLWKDAIKKPNSNLLSNFRPISLTPTPLKVMEKIVYKKLLSWLLRFHLIPRDQHGFLPDDIKIYATYDQYNCGMIRDALKCSFQRMTDWALQWDIPLNLSKSMVMHIGDTYPVDYYISGVKLTLSQCSRDLGVLFDPRLKFSLHIDHAVKKAFTNLFLLFRNIQCSDVAILSRLYKACVLPHVEYCSQVWSPCSKKNIAKIEKVQRVFTRLLWYRITHDYRRNNLPSYEERLR
ncbi:hypothetical protein OSTOST_02298, partial [Ostertagia ostertagi]